MLTLRVMLLAIVAMLASCTAPSSGSSLRDGEPDDRNDFQFSSYDVRFTNPECRTYEYDQRISSNSGDRLTAKPKNAYCKYSDGRASGRRIDSPETKLVEWIRGNDTREIWFHFLSFSNSKIANELCDAVEERNVKLTFILDQGTDLTKANQLLECRPGNGRRDYRPTMHLRGRSGGIGYAHNKLFMVNPTQADMKIAFASANLSSGVVLHHENWHFIELSEDTYFARAHRCMHEGVVNHTSSFREYARFIDQCKDDIPFLEEADIKTFFIPGEGDRATRYLVNAIERSEQVLIAAHRFSYGRLINALSDKLEDSDVEMNLIVDDDLYWAGRGSQVGANNRAEANRVSSLRRDGLNVRYMETNHEQRLLHHNKFLVLNDDAGLSAVFAGAGNLTNAGFTRNHENFYYIEVPHVVSAFNDQYDHMWNDLVTKYADLPTRDVQP